MTLVSPAALQMSPHCTSAGHALPPRLSSCQRKQTHGRIQREQSEQPGVVDVVVGVVVGVVVVVVIMVVVVVVVVVVGGGGWGGGGGWWWWVVVVVVGGGEGKGEF